MLHRHQYCYFSDLTNYPTSNKLSNKSSKQPTNSMEQGPSVKAESHSASQEFHTFYETKRIITMLTTANSCSLTWARLI